MNVTNSTSNSTSNSGHLGWTSTPNTRGSIDIIYSCFATLFLCSWTVLHLNIPSCLDSSKTIFFRKLKWMAIALVVPEFVTALAFNQWMRAWTLKIHLKSRSWSQAWFYISGGLRYSEISPADPDVPGSVEERYEPRVLLFYDNNNLLLWVPEAVILADLPSEEKIIAENKTDSLAKLIVVLQVAWFTTQCISRGASKLPISQLEIGTLAYVGCTMLTTALWWHKPLDIRLWKTLSDDEVSSAALLKPDITQEKGTRTRIYLGDSRLPNFSIHSQMMMIYQNETPGISQWVEFDPKDRLGRKRFEPTGIMEMMCGAILASLLGSVHIAAWNFEFPSKKEQTLWRVTALFTTVFPILMLTIGFIIVKVDVMSPIKWLGKVSDNPAELSWWNRRLENMKLRLYHGLRLDKLVTACGTDDGRCFYMTWIGSVLFVMLYVPARAILAESMFMSFKSMPAGVYDTVQWAENLLHL